ncbi:SEC14-like protein 4 [Culicoides brevitarsis]|uniref:SEC14-like protein 4 n=1 Tax=Culicoides brevitarsis TaxID=469753 RepID=UPI00307B4BB7
MKSPPLDLQDDQKFALMKFKRNIRDVLKPEHDDIYLVRWLKARKWNPEAAEKMFRESLKWRETRNIDNIQQWNSTHNLDPYYPYGFMGFTEQTNYPFVIIPLKDLDVNGFLRCLSKGDLVRAVIKLIEYHVNMAHEHSKTHGYNATQFIVLIDMDGFSVRQYLTKQVLDISVILAKVYEANYPCMLKKVFIINAPAIFTVAFNVLKKFLSAETIGSVKIMNSDRKKWQAAIMEVIPKEILPKHYGGLRVDANDDPRCAANICYGGKIPSEFYMTKQPSIDSLSAELENLETEFNAVILKENV